MGRKERVVIQRALMAEAFGKIEAVTEYFGAEDEYDDSKDYEVWRDKVAKFHAWVYEESPIA